MTTAEVKEFYKQKVSQLKITPRKQVIMSLVLPYLKLSLSVLDVGCGDGYLTFLMSMFTHVTGVDTDVEAQQKRFPQTEFIARDILTGLPDNKYDIVTCFDVLEHIPFDQHYMSLVNISETVKGSGLLIFNQPEQTDPSQPIDEVVTVVELINILKTFSFKLIRFENYAISRKESYNFMVFCKCLPR